METMSLKEYREYLAKNCPNYGKTPTTPQKTSKYHAEKTEVDGIRFDSKKEARDWMKLRQMEEAGLISHLQRQVKFELQPAFVSWEGKKIKPINYIADFVYIKGCQTYVQDSKGIPTKDYVLKRKMFMFKYPNIVFIES